MRDRSPARASPRWPRRPACRCSASPRLGRLNPAAGPTLRAAGERSAPRPRHPKRSSTTRPASAAGTDSRLKRSSTRTSRTASPSSPARCGHRVDEVGAPPRPAARPASAIRRAYGSSPLRDTCGLEWRRRAARLDLGAGATWAPSIHGAIGVPMWRSIASSSRCWRGSTKVIARPERPDAAGAPDAVHVDVGRGRDVEVDDVGDRRDVQAAGGDVGGDEDRHAAALEGEHHAVALALRSCRRAAP